MKKKSLLAAGALALLLGTGTTLVVTGAGRSSADASVAAAPSATPPAPPPKREASRRVIGPPAYQTVAAEAINAGAAAFRAYTDDYCDAVKSEVEAQMAAEHLTEAEVRELTYFGMLAKTSLDWDAVEAVTGHGIHPNARRYAENAMFEASTEMKKELRAQVAAGADEATRKATIERIERGYLDQYNHLTGMDSDLLDWLLWQYVQDHPGEIPADVASAKGEPPRGAVLTDRHLNELPPPPPPPADSPPPAPATPAPADTTSAPR